MRMITDEGPVPPAAQLYRDPGATLPLISSDQEFYRRITHPEPLQYEPKILTRVV